MEKKDIILNIPHSSVCGIFDSRLGGWDRNPHFVNDCVNKWTDWYTDLLFSVPAMPNVIPFVFEYSRFVVDVERLYNDEKGKEGQGIIYTNFDGYKRSEKIDRRKLTNIWETHCMKILNRIKENDILIDCHSFPSELDKDCDICVGFNDDWSFDGRIVNLIKEEFEKSGYKVKLNSPYSNSIIPFKGYNVSGISDSGYNPSYKTNYKSVMIEVNKKIYMNEKRLTLERNQRQWMRWFGCLERIYKKLSELNV